MSKRNNMGRGSAHADDAELEQNRPAADGSNVLPQPTRATQHPKQPTHTSSEQPKRTK